MFESKKKVYGDQNKVEQNTPIMFTREKQTDTEKETNQTRK